MNWLFRLFGIGKKELAPAPAPIHDDSPLVQAAPTLDDIFLEAIQESHEEIYKLEYELLNDVKLRDHIKSAVKAMHVGANKDSYDFILIHPHECGIDSKVWPVFAQILIRLCQSIGLPATDEGSYLKVLKKDVSRAFGALKKQVIDIDERTRAMLSQGIYR